MFAVAEQEVRHIQTLLTEPTAENCEAVNNKLEYLVCFLRSLIPMLEAQRQPANQNAASLAAAQDPGLRQFLELLPAEMSKIQALMQAPSRFFYALHSIRAAHGGAYERSGILKTLSSPARTVVHM